MSDILLFRDIKLKIRQDVLVIICPISQFTYQLRTDDAKAWYDKISEAIMEKEFEETSCLPVSTSKLNMSSLIAEP